MNTPDERAAYVEGLRILAQVLEDHPEVPLPYQGSDGHSPLIFGFHGPGEEARAAMAAAVRVLPCSFTKNPTDKWLNLNGQLGGLHIEVYAAREAVCTRRVVGVEEQEVEEVITPAVTRKVTKPVEIVEWDCGPVLSDAIKREPPAPTCLSCGAAEDLAVRHVPARMGIAARDEWYCEDLAACAGRRAGHLTATSGSAS